MESIADVAEFLPAGRQGYTDYVLRLRNSKS